MVRWSPRVRLMRASQAGPRPDRRHCRSLSGPGELARLRPFGFAQAEPDRLIVIGNDVLASRVINPLGHVHPAGHRVRELDLPVAVLALAGIPVNVVHPRAGLGEPLSHALAEARARARLAAPHRRPLCFLRPQLPLGQDRTLEPTYPFAGQASRIGDLLGSFASTDTVLDLLGSQRTLHFDLVLSEAGEPASRPGPAPFIDGQRETPAMNGDHENRVTSVLAHFAQAPLPHSRPFRAVLSRLPFLASRKPRPA